MKIIAHTLIIAFIAALTLALASCSVTTSPDGTKTTTVTVTAVEIAAAAQLIEAIKAPISPTVTPAK